jgi:hypothetical protein
VTLSRPASVNLVWPPSLDSAGPHQMRGFPKPFREDASDSLRPRNPRTLRGDPVV